MRKWIPCFILLMGFVALLPSPAFASTDITEFISEIQIFDDSRVVVTESVQYDFGTEEHHGIYRIIQFRYTINWASYNIKIRVLSVEDALGNAWPFSTSSFAGELKIQIGDASSYVSGLQTYNIAYEVKRAINYFDDHDELYWNITGNGWDVPIISATASVTLPEAVSEEQLQFACFTGPYGSSSQDCTSMASSSGSVVFASSDPMPLGDGLTLVLGFPKGVVEKPDFLQQALWFLSDNWPISLPLVILSIMFFLWYTRGRDPKVVSTIIPLYEPPSQLSAGEVGTVIDEKIDLKDISAAIIQLAVKGYIKIKEIETTKLFGKGRDYELQKLKEPNETLKGYEREIMKGIFDLGPTRTVSSLKNKFYLYLKTIKQSLYESLVENGFFPTNPEKVRQLYLVFSILVLPLGVFTMVYMASYVAGTATILAGIVCIVVSRFMPRKTKLGAETHKQILGFKWFLSVTETERLKFHNAPAKSPKEFEQFLPYAMVLNVEKEWSEQFKEIYLAPPDWYVGSQGAAFGAWYLASSLGSFSSDLNRAMVTAPQGTSVAGGGGSGFGGGGGGSW